MIITITSRKLKSLIKEALKEVLVLEMMKLRADLMPYVSEKEQKEIERLYGKPARKTAKRNQNGVRPHFKPIFERK